MSAARFFPLVPPLILLSTICGWAGVARAEVDISPQALNHYAFCVEQAEQYGFVYPLQRGVVYRCREDVAVAYFNDLGRRRRRTVDRFERNATGAYELRSIRDVGTCWHKVENERRQPVSFWGCDVYVAY
ncbi:hypothetical protein [Rhodoblastus sp.]|uniref:hypothetical protein n=1 Tax=Rhodoblastus sp. TaxID=1962975 RepID=UPI002636554A|nr:hypothetical protein [Rhodoblastus sp.]